MTDELADRLVAGRYRVRERLGQGGMGAVYVALDTHDGDREVALKIIKDTLVDSAEAGARFDREAAALRDLEHENIVRFLAAGVDDGVRFIAMERLNGRTLKDRVTKRGSMPWRDTLPILRGMVAALEAAHARGLIHRDLKPENVMLVEQNGTTVVKLLDFGVAKHTQLPDGMTMTGTGIIVGTPGFVAPEVVLYGASDDPRSDFYGLGATWFEMLTGAKPFEAATPFALAMRHVSERPPRPTDLRPFDPVPIPVEALLFRLLAKSAGERPATARALLDELAVLEDAVRRGVDIESTTMPTMTDMRTPQPTGVIVRRAPLSRLVIGAVVAIVIAVIAVVASRPEPVPVVKDVVVVPTPPAPMVIEVSKSEPGDLDEEPEEPVKPKIVRPKVEKPKPDLLLDIPTTK